MSLGSRPAKTHLVSRDLLIIIKREKALRIQRVKIFFALLLRLEIH